jgi:hypothetical protein
VGPIAKLPVAEGMPLRLKGFIRTYIIALDDGPGSQQNTLVLIACRFIEERRSASAESRHWADRLRPRPVANNILLDPFNMMQPLDGSKLRPSPHHQTRPGRVLTCPKVHRFHTNVLVEVKSNERILWVRETETEIVGLEKTL